MNEDQKYEKQIKESHVRPVKALREMAAHPQIKRRRKAMVQIRTPAPRDSHTPANDEDSNAR